MAPAGGRSARRSWTRRARRGARRGAPFPGRAHPHRRAGWPPAGAPPPRGAPRPPPARAGRPAALAGGTFAGEDVVIVGDTPDDVACGRPVGARAVAVATGFYDVAALRAAGAAHVFATLADTAAVLDAIFA